MSDQPKEIPQPNIVIGEAQMAGVYANYAQVGHTAYEFTLDFARIDHGQTPPQGIVVARVSLSPLLVSQLIDALNTNWARYIEKAMPPEVTRSAEGESDPRQERDRPPDAVT